MGARQQLWGEAIYFDATYFRNDFRDLIVFDFNTFSLENVGRARSSGVELTRRARKLPHRRRIPIIMFSAGNCETEAWSAGVDAFLRKPDEILSVAETVSRLVDVKTPIS